jgi:hypothetical protein
VSPGGGTWHDTAFHDWHMAARYREAVTVSPRAQGYGGPGHVPGDANGTMVAKRASMQGFLKRLLVASQWGATLALVAGCSGEVVNESGETLEPTPEATCEGEVYEDDFGYHGQCCYNVVCISAEGGTCANPGSLEPQSPGSGECECGTRKGPYLNNDPASDDECCYLFGEIGCDGRPLLIGGAPRLAEVISGTGAWSEQDPAMSGPETRREGARRAAMSAAGGELGAEASAKVAQRWAERARFEHASIASFARFSMELLACGAPPALVAAAQQAGLDEVRHAQLALGIAAEYAGKRLDLGRLDVAGALSGPMTLEAITVATVVEGCVGETLAAMEAEATAAVAGPRVRGALSVIAEDEARHAELAWAFVRWAADVGGAALRARIRAAFAQALEQVRAEAIEAAGEADDVDVTEHGFLPAAEVARLRKKAIDEVLRPAASALLSGARAREEAVFQKAA